MSNNPRAGKGKDVTNPLTLYDELAKSEEFEVTINNQAGWTWDDQFLESDFNRLKLSEDPSITTVLTNLQCFYLMYFGEIATPVNPGGLFCQILATAPHFTSTRD